MEIDCLQRNATFKFKMTLDRHNARQNLNYCVLPGPPHFSLPSTFKPKWHSLRLLPFQGPKKSQFRAQPFQCSSKLICPHQNHCIPSHINNRVHYQLISPRAKFIFHSPHKCTCCYEIIYLEANLSMKYQEMTKLCTNSRTFCPLIKEYKRKFQYFIILHQLIVV